MRVELIDQPTEAIDKIATIASICYGRNEARDPQKLVEEVESIELLRSRGEGDI